MADESAAGGLAEPIGVTGQHLVWSVDRNDWVAAAELAPLERVRVLGAMGR